MGLWASSATFSYSGDGVGQVEDEKEDLQAAALLLRGWVGGRGREGDYFPTKQ